LAVAVAIALFVPVATANSGGYRYGVSDQAFYVPAIAGAVHPELFPRDRALLDPQMRRWAGDELIGWLVGRTGTTLPAVFATLYLATLVALAMAGVALVRGLGGSWWTVAATLALLALRHRIAKTGANSLEGYMHPRMLAFALGVAGFAMLVRGRTGAAALWTIGAGLVHTTTAGWFALAIAAGHAWVDRERRSLWMGAGAVVTVSALLFVLSQAGPLARMDEAWLAVLEEKDYLFAADWPTYAWATNMAYPVLILAAYRSRRRRGALAPGEPALVAGLLALVVVFLISVPLTEARLALAVQAQVNRVFWLLDAVCAAYVAWWITSGVRQVAANHRRSIAVAVLVTIAVARGIYIVAIEADRSLVQVDLPDTAWTDVMRWVQTQPSDWLVLTDPDHGWKFGSSVRVAAWRDTVLESGKDTAMAMYDRDIAVRIADRRQALSTFADFTSEDVRSVGRRYGAHVLVDRGNRRFALPVLYRNAEFVVYDLR
jgi:hypothetical protein